VLAEASSSSHEDSTLEDAIERLDGHALVAKKGVAAAVARSKNPR
jgi:hypothetical protein